MTRFLTPFSLMLLLLAGILPAGAMAKSTRNPEYSSQHPTVRAVLRERFVRARSLTDNFGHRTFRGNPMMLDQWIEQAAVDLFRDIDEKLTRMSADLDEAKVTWQQLCDAGFSDETLQRKWKENITDLAEAAGGLRGTIDQVLPRLGGGDGFAVNQGNESGQYPFEGEMQLLEVWVDAAQRQIDRYFFSADQSVLIGELRGPGMSRYLELVHDLAARLAKGN